MIEIKSQWDFLDELCRIPSLIAGSVDVANGLFIACAATILAESRGMDYGAALTDVWRMVREVTKDVPKYPEHIALLGYEQIIPTKKVSFPAFINHARELAAMLPRGT